MRLTEPRLIATTVGRDENGGIARVRISIKRRTTCNGRTRPEVGYYPPPQIERIRSNPGANLPTEKTRTRRIALAGEGCTTHGEVWGEAINGSGLEAVTPHIRFTTQF